MTFFLVVPDADPQTVSTEVTALFADVKAFATPEVVRVERLVGGKKTRYLVSVAVDVPRPGTKRRAAFDTWAKSTTRSSSHP